MSKRTIRMVDLYCEIANVNDSIETVRDELARYAGGRACWPKHKAEAEGELQQWTLKRDRKLARLLALMAALTDTELDLICRKYNPDEFRDQLSGWRKSKVVT